MSRVDQYRTLVAPSQGDYRERGSKFLAHAYPCSSESELKAQIEGLKKANPSARHFCYGSVINPERPAERNSDDGEPSGTAGLPILNQILSAGLCNVSVVVVRHFGGTKLGKPGLIQAYKESARLALESAKTAERWITRNVVIRFEYPQSGAVMQAVEKFPNTKIVSQQFLESCELTVAVPKSALDNALHLFDHLPDVDISPAI